MSNVIALDEKYSGKIELFGHDMKMDRKKVIDRVGIISEDYRSAGFFMECDATENIMMLSDAYEKWDKNTFVKMMDEMCVSRCRPLNELSRGNYVKFQLAWAAAHG